MPKLPKSLRDAVDFKRIVNDTISRTVAGLAVVVLLLFLALALTPTRKVIDDGVPVWLLILALLGQAIVFLSWYRYRSRKAARSRQPPTLSEFPYADVLWPLRAYYYSAGRIEYEPGSPICPDDRTALGLVLIEDDPDEKPHPLESWPKVAAERMLFECFACQRRFDLRSTGYSASQLVNIVARLAVGQTRTAQANRAE